jgi:DNA-binding MarR family transcriptional regulator
VTSSTPDCRVEGVPLEASEARFRASPKSRTRDTESTAEGPTEGLREACEQLVHSSLRTTRSEANFEGLSIPQSFLLLNLARLGRIPIGQLVVSSGNSPATVGGILDGLESMGAVRREHGVEDRRQVLVSLTPEGERVAARLEARRAIPWVPLDATLRPDDAATAARVLGMITTEFTAWKRDGRGLSQRPRVRGPVDRATFDDLR